MNAEIVHQGFDGLRVTVEADIPPELRKVLFDAKSEAIASSREVTIETSGFALSVRRSGGSAFSAHTGEYGAEFYFLDPENRPANNPGITVDFRAYFLAFGGLADAQRYFEKAMNSLGIQYAETQLRISRVDYAIDFLAPWFEPQHEALILPARTGKREFRQGDTREKFFANTVVTGITAGHVTNRQLVVYDKRAEIMTKRKLGWLEIWNQNRARNAQPPLELNDRDQSQVWRFEARMGSKCLRRRWEIRSWFDLDAMIGDAYAEFVGKIRYALPNHDQNRSRWPDHELWGQVCEVYRSDLAKHRSGIVADDVKTVNREDYKQMLDGQLLGLFCSRAAASGVFENDFNKFVVDHARHLLSQVERQGTDIEVKIAKAAAKRRFR